MITSTSSCDIVTFNTKQGSMSNKIFVKIASLLEIRIWIWLGVKHTVYS